VTPPLWCPECGEPTDEHGVCLTLTCALYGIEPWPSAEVFDELTRGDE